MARSQPIAYRTPGPPQRVVPLVPADDTLTSLVPHITATFDTPLPVSMAASAATVSMPRFAPGAVLTDRVAVCAPRRDRRRRRRVLGAVLLLLLSIALLLGLRTLHERAAVSKTQAVAAQALQRGSAAALLRAREVLQEALRARPQSLALQAARARVLGALLVECGGIADTGVEAVLEAEASAAAAPLRDMTTTDALAAQAYLALWRGDAAGAARLAATLRGAADEPGLADYFTGLAALWRGDATAAAAALERSPGSSALRQVWRARALLALQQDDAARAALERALREQPDQPAALVALAGLDALGGARREQAQQELRGLATAGQGRGPRAAAYVALAEVALAPPAPSLAAARQALQQARALRPAADPLLLSHLTLENDLLTALPEGQAASAARLMLLRGQIQRGELSAAQRQVEQILAEHPVGEQLAQARLLLAQLGLLQRPPLRDEALELLQSVVAEAPEMIEAREQLGRLLLRGGRPAEAVVQLREARRLRQAGVSPKL